MERLQYLSNAMTVTTNAKPATPQARGAEIHAVASPPMAPAMVAQMIATMPWVWTSANARR